jgi:hypothetical protein
MKNKYILISPLQSLHQQQVHIKASEVCKIVKNAFIKYFTLNWDILFHSSFKMVFWINY